MNSYKKDQKRKVWNGEKQLGSKHATLFVTLGGGNVMAWSCMAASGNGSLVFFDDVTIEVTGWLWCVEDWLYSQIEPNAKKHLTVQMDNHPNHTAKATQEVLKAKTWYILRMSSELHDPNLIKHFFQLLKIDQSEKMNK